MQRKRFLATRMTQKDQSQVVRIGKKIHMGLSVWMYSSRASEERPRAWGYILDARYRNQSESSERPGEITFESAHADELSETGLADAREGMYDMRPRSAHKRMLSTPGVVLGAGNEFLMWSLVTRQGWHTSHGSTRSAGYDVQLIGPMSEEVGAQRDGQRGMIGTAGDDNSGLGSGGRPKPIAGAPRSSWGKGG